MYIKYIQTIYSVYSNNIVQKRVKKYPKYRCSIMLKIYTTALH